jgi:hypothetical protein
VDLVLGRLRRVERDVAHGNRSTVIR